MEQFIAERRPEVERLCRRNGVLRLDLVSSAAASRGFSPTAASASWRNSTLSCASAGPMPTSPSSSDCKSCSGGRLTS